MSDIAVTHILPGKTHAGGIAAVVRATRARLVDTSAVTWYYLPVTPTVASDPEPGVGDNSDGDAVFSLARTQDIEAWLLSLDPGFGHAWNEAEMHLARRLEHPVVLVQRDDVPIACARVAIKQAWINDFDRAIDLPPQLAFIHDLFIHPDYRNAGLARHVVAFAAAELRALGYSALACHIHDSNRASITIFRRCGFLPVGRSRFVRIGSLATKARRVEQLLLDTHRQFTGS